MTRIFSILLILIFSVIPFRTFTQSATISASKTGGCAPLLVNFDASQSSGDGQLHFYWDFGNGNFADGINLATPSAFFANSGVFKVQLHVIDELGNQSEQVTLDIEVFENPKPDFEISSGTKGCLPYTAQFKDLTQIGNSPITKWKWGLGDGTLSTTSEPSHTYYQENHFKISLLVEDENGCKGSITKDDYLSTTHPQDPEITLVSPFDKTTTCANSLEVLFEAVADTAQYGPYEFSWNFGDNTEGKQSIISHNYSNYGVYSVQLTMSTPYCTTSVVKNELININQITPSFVLDSTSGCTPLTVSLTNTSVQNNDDFYATWHFGNGDSLVGISSDIDTISYTYSTEGDFKPYLKLSSLNESCEDRTDTNSVQIIHASDQITPPITLVDSISCDPNFTFNFNCNHPKVNSVLWKYGDGNMSTSQNTTHQYFSEGLFSISVETIDEYGCKSFNSKANVIDIETPKAFFTSDIEDANNIQLPQHWTYGFPNHLISGGCIPVDFTFIDNSTSNRQIIRRDWNFGDGSYNTSNNSTITTNTYTTVGRYDVTLEIETEDGCVNTFVCNNCAKAGTPPIALLDTTGYPLEQCCGGSTEFINLTAPGTADFFWYQVNTGEGFGMSFSPSGNHNWEYEQDSSLTSGNQLSTTLFAYKNGCLDTFQLNNWTTIRTVGIGEVLEISPCFRNDSLIIDSIQVTSNADSVQWHFEYLNQTSNDLRPRFRAPASGVYDLTSTAFDKTNVWDLSNGESYCSCSSEEEYEFPELDTANFIESDTTGCVPLIVSFSVPNAFSQYEWDFGNGKTSSSVQPVVYYEQGGDFDVTLITTDQYGCKDTLTKDSLIQPFGVEAYIASDDIFECIPFNVSMLDTSKYDAPFVSREWSIQYYDFTSDDTLLQYDFSQLPDNNSFLQKNGSQVILKVVDSLGCINRDTLIIHPLKPSANHLFSQNIKCDYDEIIFSQITHDSIGLHPLSYTWEMDIENQETSVSENDSLHIYKDGTYNSRLIVEDQFGCSDTSAIRTYEVEISKPLANFGGDSLYSTCLPHIVNFQDSSLIGRSPIIKWNYSFGDDNEGSIQNPSNIYSLDTSFNVSLFIQDSVGCVDTITKVNYVIVEEIGGELGILNSRFCVNDTINFRANSPTGVHFSWDLGDGNISFSDNTDHNYLTSGAKAVKLIVEDEYHNCYNLFSETIYINDLPKSNLLVDTTICENTSLQLDFPTDSLLYYWSTKDSSRSININKTGLYTVILTDTTTQCINYDTLQLSHHSIPIHTDSDVKKYTCYGDSIVLSPNFDRIINETVWYHDSKFIDSVSILNYEIQEDIELKFTFTDENNCTDTSSYHVNVTTPPTISDTLFLCEEYEGVLLGNNNEINDTLGSYSWVKNDAEIINSKNLSVAYPDQKFTLIFTQDECELSIPKYIEYYKHPDRSSPSDTIFCIYDTGELEITYDEYSKYFWFHTDDSSNTTVIDDSGVYPFSYGNEHNCFTYDTLSVQNMCGPRIHLANAFSPNDDGINDVFEIKHDHVGYFDMKVFNKWGEIIYHTGDIEQSWDGTYKGSNAPVGSYSYVIEYSSAYEDQDWIMQKRGKLSLIR